MKLAETSASLTINKLDMNSKIFFAFVLAVDICIITVTAKVYSYKVTVQTANEEFGSYEGKFKLSVMNNNSNEITQEDFELTPNDVEIEEDEIYVSEISSTAPFKNITSVYLQWTLAIPNNPYNAIEKPKIIFTSVSLSFFELRPFPQWSPCESHIFLPETSPIAIEHDDGARFNLRHVIWEDAFYGERSNISVLDAKCYA